MTARIPYSRTYWVIDSQLPAARRAELYTAAGVAQVTAGPSYDDAGIGEELGSRTAVLWDRPQAERMELVAWFEHWYPGTAVVFDGGGGTQHRPGDPPAAHLVSQHHQPSPEHLAGFQEVLELLQHITAPGVDPGEFRLLGIQKVIDEAAQAFPGTLEISHSVSGFIHHARLFPILEIPYSPRASRPSQSDTEE